uniref:Venom gland peptide U17-PHTX-Pmx1b n=1 Tax=Periegops suteri TaxID=440353 RepID=A0A6B9KLR0_9ARAC|nr:venom gland peptide U17-PHTX-Pmx1b [Periegops suteri]
MYKFLALVLIISLATVYAAEKYCDCGSDECCVKMSGYTEGFCKKIGGLDDRCGFPYGDGMHYRRYCPCKPGFKCVITFAGTDPYACQPE